MNVEERIDRAAKMLNGQFTKKQIKKVANALTQVDTEALLNGEAVKIANYGTTQEKVRNTRTGTNPRTHKPIEIEKHKTIVFEPSQNLKAALNER